jgi:hypothetical protein
MERNLLQVLFENRKIAGAHLEIEPPNQGGGLPCAFSFAAAAQGREVTTTSRAARIRVFITLPIVDETRNCGTV